MSEIAGDEHGERVERLTRGADLSPVADVLEARRDEILARWVEVTRRQLFHHGRREHAVADHLPHLIDGLVAVLRRTAPREADPEAPLDDERVLEAAKNHAFVRFEQGSVPRISSPNSDCCAMRSAEPCASISTRMSRQPMWWPQSSSSTMGWMEPPRFR